MDDNTIGNIESNVVHAVGEIEGIVNLFNEPERIYHCLQAAESRLRYIRQLLAEAGVNPPA